ncbi:MAG: 50S ribosomal protein L9 [Patescibacteria group bacterium]
MKVVLIKDVPNLGKKGDTKDVKDGYGRNFLVINKLAEILTPTILKNLKLEKEKEEKISVELKKRAELLKEKIKNLNLVFKVKVGKLGEAFGSVTPLKIQNELKKQGINLEKEQILTNPIKTLGTSKIKIKLNQDFESYLIVSIEPEK